MNMHFSIERITSRFARLGSGGRPLLVALISSVLVAGCAPIEGPPEVGQEAPTFDVWDLQGNVVNLEELRGSPVLLNMWATWCAPCRVETPFLQSIYESHQDRGLRIVGLSMDSSGEVDEIREFLDANGVTYDVLHDPTMASADLYYVIGLPATFLIDEEGTLRFSRIGMVHENDEAFFQALEDVLGD